MPVSGMNLFNKKSLVNELSESKAAFTALETQFSEFKSAHAEFEAKKEELSAKVSSYEAELESLKAEKLALSVDLETAKTSISELENKAASVTSAALIELEKVGQAPIAQVAPTASVDEAKLWEDYMELRGKGKHEEARAFYLKNLKAKK